MVELTSVDDHWVNFACNLNPSTQRNRWLIHKRGDLRLSLTKTSPNKWFEALWRSLNFPRNRELTLSLPMLNTQQRFSILKTSLTATLNGIYRTTSGS